MVTIFELSKEESTSIYWSGNDSELVGEAEQSVNQVVPEEVVAATMDSAMDSPIVKKLRYLSEPFPRSAYRPLQFLVNGQLLTGDISVMTDSQIALEVQQESKDMNEIRTLDLQEIEEVFWKGSPFR